VPANLKTTELCLEVLKHDGGAHMEMPEDMREKALVGVPEEMRTTIRNRIRKDVDD